MNVVPSLLISQTLQVTLLATIVWIATRCFASNRPRVAHALWVLVLIKCITPPIWSSPISPFSWIATTSWINESMEEPQQIPRSFEQRSVVPSRHEVIEFTAATPAIELSPSVRSETVRPDASPAGTVSRKHPIASTNRRFAFGESWSALAILTGIWLAGIGLTAVVILIRSISFLVWMRGGSRLDYPEATRLLRQLSTRIGVRQSARLWITDRPVGPAVMGVFRPTIMLPESIVARNSISDLSSLLTHELIHIRRGDLVWALVQAMARIVFWFHPLVWLASSEVSRESERSCDEETIAALGCRPSEYARILLQVLEEKHRLRAAPSVPAVRAVEITTDRLERIMTLGNGVRSSQWTQWIVILGCLFVLPGAALVSGQHNDPERPKPVPEPNSAGDTTTEGAPLRESGHASESPQTLPSAYYLDDDIQYFPKGPEGKLRSENEILAAAAQGDWKDESPAGWRVQIEDIQDLLDRLNAEGHDAQQQKFAADAILGALPCRYPEPTAQVRRRRA